MNHKVVASDFSKKLDLVVESAKAIFELGQQVTALLGDLFRTTPFGNRRDYSKGMEFNEKDEQVTVDSRELRRLKADAKKAIKFLMSGTKKIEITNIPLDSLKSDISIHPKGQNIRNNIASFVEGVLKDSGFNETQNYLFNFILHELFLNARKYQAIVLGLLEDGSKNMLEHHSAAMETIIKKEQLNEISEDLKITFEIINTPDFLVFAIYSPTISEAKLEKAHFAMTHLALVDSNQAQKISDEQNRTENSGLGLGLSTKMVNTEFPMHSALVIHNDLESESMRGFSRVVLKKPEAEAQAETKDIAS